MSDVLDENNESPKPAKRRAADKAGAILAGAMQEFMTYGYAAASMDRISVAAGVSKPTLYSYFQDKEGLFAALVHQMTQGSSAPKPGDEHWLQMPLHECLKQLATMMLDELSDKQSLFTLVRLIIGESGRFPALAKAFVRNIEKPNLERLSRLLANHPDSKATDPELAARFFMGSLVHYVIVQEILHGRDILPLERDRFVDGLVSMVLAEPSDSQSR